MKHSGTADDDDLAGAGPVAAAQGVKSRQASGGGGGGAAKASAVASGDKALGARSDAAMARRPRGERARRRGRQERGAAAGVFDAGVVADSGGGSAFAAAHVDASRRFALSRLKEETGLKEPLNFIAAARDVILSPQLGFEGLCAIHSLLLSWDVRLHRLGRQEALTLRPPSCALRLDRPADAALVGNVQLLLQSSTPNGGSSSRSVSFPSTIAVAIEMIRGGGLNFTVACIRHGVKMADYQSESHVPSGSPQCATESSSTSLSATTRGPSRAPP